MRAYQHFQSAVILLSQFGFNATDVWSMCHAEVASWVAQYLKSKGIKQNVESGDGVHYHFVNRKKERGKGA